MKPDIVADLEAEHAALDARLDGLTEEQWRLPTPAAGWDIADSVSHLHYFDERALLALTDRPAFARHREEVLANGLDLGDDVGPGRSMPGAALLAAWRERRRLLLAAMRACDPSQRILWYGPEMSLTSFVTARAGSG